EPIDIFNKQERDSEVEKLIGKAAKADHIAARTSKGIAIKIDEDPIFYKRLSELIKATIQDYKQSRIDETEYLNRIKDIEERFLEGKQENVRAIIDGNKIAVAFFNFIQEKLVGSLKDKEQNAAIALKIQDLITDVTIADSKPIVDWKFNKEIEKQIWSELDDYFYALSMELSIQIPFDVLDAFVEEIIKIAKKQMN